ncbi:MAG TPA: EamA family transporter [Acidimicrobiia bacterium]|nr:EamA family transporter [Acidimicrobiia bacterium]
MVLIAFLAIIVLGGSNAVAIKIGNAELPPFWGATLRFGLATVLLAVIALITRPPWPHGRALLGAVLYGLIGFAASNAFAYLGLVDAPAGVAGVLVAVAPLLTLLLAIAQRLEKFRWQGLAGSLVAGAGIAVVSGNQLGVQVPLLSVLLLFGAAFCIAETNVIAKLIPPGHPISANLIGAAIATVVLGAISVFIGEAWELPTEANTWASVLYLASVGSVALFLTYLFVLARWTATATSYALLLMPLWTVAAAALLLKESINPAFVVGGALVIGGTYVGAFLSPRPHNAPVCQPCEAAPVAVSARANGISG